MRNVVGIDLGTTNSVVATAFANPNGEPSVRVIPDEEGKTLTPSVISFHPSGDILVGRGARARRLIDARNTIFSVKRLLGHPWNSPVLAEARARSPFELREGPSEGCVVRARGHDYSLPELSAIVLRRLREIASRDLGENVTQAVITVPAHFNELQRASTKIAGRVAGLDVLRILNEPTAAALAYGLGKAGRERVAVYDFGGGTFDCTILDLNGSVYEVLATAGDTFLGGDDVDIRIADRMNEELLSSSRYDARSDPQAYERLRVAAEEIKWMLSRDMQAEIRIPEVAYGVGGRALDFRFSMSRPELERIAIDLVDRTLQVTGEALAVAKLSPTSIDRVILVGGSTRMPLVQRRVEMYFGKPALSTLNPDEVVAMGAAIQAAALLTSSASEPLPAAPPVLRSTASMPGAPPPSPASVPPSTSPGLFWAPGEEDTSKGAPLGMPPQRIVAKSIPPQGLFGSIDDETRTSRHDPRNFPEGAGGPALSPAPAGATQQLPSFPKARASAPSFHPGPSERSPNERPPSAPPPLPPAAKTISIAPSSLMPAPPAPYPPSPDVTRQMAAFASAPVLVDVTPRALVVETAGGFTDVLIPRNARIPCDRTRFFSTARDGQTSVRIRVAQGESPRFGDNTFLGELWLTEIPPAPRGALTLDVTFELDEGGTLQVRAKDQATGASTHAVMQLVGGTRESQVPPMMDRVANLPVRGGYA
ncbi:MAG: Hsp70 family protein [Polyangiaceae bacterium]